MSHRYCITDVFAEGPYAGNQLATVFDAMDIASDEMQKIARAFNFPETTFILGGSLEAGFDVRIFTPAAEVPFAGHPTLGTAFLIRENLVSEATTRITLNLGVGKIPVDFGDDGVLWMQQQAPTFGETLERASVAADLGLSVTDLDPDLPVQRVSTGLDFVIVPLNSPEALKRAYSPRGSLGRGVLVFCRGSYDDGQSLMARLFADELGVTEDPATGSANGCLAAYLVNHDYFGDSGNRVRVNVGQGYEIKRPSQLYLDAGCEGGEAWSIRVGGRVALVAEGQWLR